MGFVNIDLLVKFTIGCILLVVGVNWYNNTRQKERANAIAAIEASSNAVLGLMRAGQTDSIARYYAEDAVLMPANMATIRGRPAIRAFLAGFPRMAEARMTVDTIMRFGDLAYVRGTYFARFNDSTIPADSGKYIEIRRLIDGQWLIIEEIANSSVPLPQGTP